MPYSQDTCTSNCGHMDSDRSGEKSQEGSDEGNVTNRGAEVLLNMARNGRRNLAASLFPRPDGHQIWVARKV